MLLNNSNININTTKVCSSNISSRPCNSSKASYSTHKTWRKTCRCPLCSSHPLTKTHLTLNNSNIHNHSNNSSHQAAQENRTGKFLRAFLTQCTPKQISTYHSTPTRMSMSHQVRGTGILREEEFGGVRRVNWINTTGRLETLSFVVEFGPESYCRFRMSLSDGVLVEGVVSYNDQSLDCEQNTHG